MTSLPKEDEETLRRRASWNPTHILHFKNEWAPPVSVMQVYDRGARQFDHLYATYDSHMHGWPPLYVYEKRLSSSSWKIWDTSTKNYVDTDSIDHIEAIRIGRPAERVEPGEPSDINAAPTEVVGKKFDKGKPRWSLLVPGFVAGIISILEDGANEYGKENWKSVTNFRERYYNAMMRHIEAWWGGEIIDPKSRKHHLLHVGCNIMFLIWGDMNPSQVNNDPDLDERLEEPDKKTPG